MDVSQVFWICYDSERNTLSCTHVCISNINDWSQNYRVSPLPLFCQLYLHLNEFREIRESKSSDTLQCTILWDEAKRKTNIQMEKFEKHKKIQLFIFWLRRLQLFGWSVFSEFTALLVPLQRLNTPSTLDKIHHVQRLSESCILTYQWAEGGRRRQKQRYSSGCHSLKWY